MTPGKSNKDLCEEPNDDSGLQCEWDPLLFVGTDPLEHDADQWTGVDETEVRTGVERERTKNKKQGHWKRVQEGNAERGKWDSEGLPRSRMEKLGAEQLELCCGRRMEKGGPSEAAP